MIFLLKHGNQSPSTSRFLTFSEKEIGLALCLQWEGCCSDWSNTDSIFSTPASVIPGNLCRVFILCFLLMILSTTVLYANLRDKEPNLTYWVLSLPVFLRNCCHCPAESHAGRVITSSLERWTACYCFFFFFFFFLLFSSHAQIWVWSIWQLEFSLHGNIYCRFE